MIWWSTTTCTIMVQLKAHGMQSIALFSKDLPEQQATPCRKLTLL